MHRRIAYASLVAAVAAGALGACSNGAGPGAPSQAPSTSAATASGQPGGAAERPFRNPTTAQSPGPEVVDPNGDPVFFLTGLEVGKLYGDSPDPNAPNYPTNEPATELFRERVYHWNTLEVASVHELRVHLVGGDESCYGYRVAWEEVEGVLRLAVIEGSVEPDLQMVCTDIGVGLTLSVPTTQDLTQIVVVEAGVDEVNLRP